MTRKTAASALGIEIGKASTTKASDSEESEDSTSDSEVEEDTCEQSPDLLSPRSAHAQDQDAAANVYKVLQSWPELRTSFIWLGALPANSSWRCMHKCLYVLYRSIVIPVAALIACPYVVYQEAWFGIYMKTLSMSGKCLITLTASAPVLSWVCLFHYVRSSHFLKTWLSLAARYKHRAGMTAASGQMRSHIVWALGMTALYMLWTARNLGAQWAHMTLVAKVVMSMVLATFVYRAAASLVLCYAFQVTIQLHRETIFTWIMKWAFKQDGDICACLSEMDENVALRNCTQDSWFYNFIVLCAVPCLVAVLLTYSTVMAPEDARFSWLEFGYSLYLLRQLYLVVDASRSLNSDAQKYCYMMVQQIARGEASFRDISILQQQAFLEYITGSYKCFTILGFKISYESSARVLQGCAVALSPVLYKALRSLGAYYGVLPAIHPLHAGANASGSGQMGA